MEDIFYFDSQVSKADFFSVELSPQFREHLASLTPQKAESGVLDYDRSYGDIHILIEVIKEMYSIYLKDYNFGHIKPLGECVYEVAKKPDTLEYGYEPIDVVIADLHQKIACGEIDMTKELYDYYHIIPDEFIPFIEGRISDHITVGEAADLLGISDARVKKMVSDRVLDGFKRNGRVYLSKADVERRKDYIDKHGKPTKSSAKKSSANR